MKLRRACCHATPSQLPYLMTLRAKVVEMPPNHMLLREEPDLGVIGVMETHTHACTHVLYFSNFPSLGEGQKPELKRRSSKSELKRQLSKQVSITSLDEKQAKVGGATERTKLIGEEKVETGNV